MRTHFQDTSPFLLLFRNLRHMLLLSFISSPSSIWSSWKLLVHLETFHLWPCHILVNPDLSMFVCRRTPKKKSAEITRMAYKNHFIAAFFSPLPHFFLFRFPERTWFLFQLGCSSMFCFCFSGHSPTTIISRTIGGRSERSWQWWCREEGKIRQKMWKQPESQGINWMRHGEIGSVPWTLSSCKESCNEGTWHALKQFGPISTRPCWLMKRPMQWPASFWYVHPLSITLN